MPTCAEGHDSAAADYCDVCGAPIATSPAQPTAVPALQVQACPVCEAPMSGRFCEACGHDSALPEPAPPAEAAAAPIGWTAVVTADREFHQRMLARGGPDTVQFPQYFPERRIRLDKPTTLIGRHNRDQGVEPEIDLGIHPVDRGVSTQHAVLRIRESGLTVTDLGSTNGTSLNDSDQFLPNGEETPLSDGDRIHVGAWTTITIMLGQ
ncbi:FHA domain-containing protein [Mycobacterium sp. MMS18-G62]